MTLAEMPLRQIVSEHPAAAAIFDRFEIDLCEMGEKSITEACACLSLSAEQLQEKLTALDSVAAADVGDPHQRPLAQLIQRIVRAHHRRIRQDLPALAQMAATLEQKQSSGNPGLMPMARLVAQLHREMLEHIGREEDALFPLLARMEEEAGLHAPVEPCGPSLRIPIARMTKDHRASGSILEELSQRTNGFDPAPNACATQRALFAGLKNFDSDLREHLQLEEDILFPRALQLEIELEARRLS